MKTKKIISTIKVFVPSNQAIPQPPLGPILAQNRVDMNSFCKKFNEETTHLSPGIILPVKIKRFHDKSQIVSYGPPTISEIIYQLIEINNKISLNIEVVWDTVILIEQFNNLDKKIPFDKKKLMIVSKTVFSSINSIKITKDEI